MILSLEALAGLDREKEAGQAARRLLDAIRPQEYGGPSGIEAKMAAAYEDSCIALSQHISRDPKLMTVLEFRRAIRMISSQAKQEKQTRKKR